MNIFDKNLIEGFSDPNLDSIVLFHGYGADANDLAPLSEYIPTSKKFNWYFPNGPLSIPLGGAWMGRAWWPIPLERYQQEGKNLDVSEEVPNGIDKLAIEFKKWLSAKNIDSKKLILGGFSQGGMLALDLFFELEAPPKALLLLSTNLINKKNLKTKFKKEMLNSQYFLSHGTSDPVLPISGSDRLQSFLNEYGIKGKKINFNGGHEIPPNILLEMGKFISQ